MLIYTTLYRDEDETQLDVEADVIVSREHDGRYFELNGVICRGELIEVTAEERDEIMRLASERFANR